MHARERAQILNLLKSIHLVRPAEGEMPSAQFFPGVHRPFTFPTGIAISWWFDKRARIARTSVASLLLGSSSKFLGCDQKTAQEVVLKTLQETCNDSHIFLADEVVFAKRSTLFECLKGDVSQCAAKIFALMQANLSIVMGRYCTVFLVPRLQLPSFSVESYGIDVVAVGDRDAWSRILQKDFVFNGWKPGISDGPGIDPAFSPPADYYSVLVLDASGTRSGIKSSNILKARAFLAVVFSCASRAAPYPYLKGSVRTYEYCAQFPHVSAPEQVRERSDTEPLIPRFLDDVILDQTGVSQVSSWFAALEICPPDLVARIEKAAHFLNMGINASGTAGFVNLFVALDALLGRMGSVEASILEGLGKLGFEEVDINRAKCLFQLRNELVHGGSRYVEEWNYHACYLRRFDSDPMRDVQRIAEMAVLWAPDRLR